MTIGQFSLGCRCQPIILLCKRESRAAKERVRTVTGTVALYFSRRETQLSEYGSGLISANMSQKLRFQGYLLHLLYSVRSLHIRAVLPLAFRGLSLPSESRTKPCLESMDCTHPLVSFFTDGEARSPADRHLHLSTSRIALNRSRERFPIGHGLLVRCRIWDPNPHMQARYARHPKH